MAFWTVNFMSRNGDSYQIKIAGASGATDVPLVPDESPFYTEEEGKEDLFLPIKTQSGYVNIITDDVNLVRTIIPTTGGTRIVEVYRMMPQSSSVLVWQGYVQPRLLSMKIWRGKQKIQIPVECPLSALKYRAFNTNRIRMNMAELLYMILGNSFFDYYLQGECIETTTQEGYNRSWLTYQVSTMLFMSNQKTHMDVLEAVCTFYGWTARSNGTSVYLLSSRNIDNIGSKKITLFTDQDLYNEQIPNDYDEWEQADFVDGSIADNNTTLVLSEGINGASVVCNLARFDQSIESPDNDVSEAINDQVLNPGTVDTSYVEEEYRVDRYYYDYITNVHVGEWTINSYNARYWLNKNGSNDVNDWTYSIWAETTQWMGYYIDDPSVQRVVGAYKGWVTFLSDEIFSFVDGKLTITPKRGKYEGGSLRIKIGTKWFDPDRNTWEDQPSHPLLYNENVESLEIPIPPSGLTGAILIEISTDHTYTSIIDGFEIIFESADTQEVNTNLSEVSHSASGNALFDDVKSVDSLLCVQERYIRNSMNFVLDSDGITPLTGIYDYTDQYAKKFNPLQRLADNMATEMSVVGEMYKINVRRELIGVEITPLTLLYVEHLDAMLYPVSISRDWRDNVLKLKLLKRIMSGQ